MRVWQPLLLEPACAHPCVALCPVQVAPPEPITLPPLKTWTFIPVTGQIIARLVVVDSEAAVTAKAPPKAKAAAKAAAAAKATGATAAAQGDGKSQGHGVREAGAIPCGAQGRHRRGRRQQGASGG